MSLRHVSTVKWSSSGSKTGTLQQQEQPNELPDVQLSLDNSVSYTACPTRYRTRHFFNNFTTNENIATKFEADLPHCVRNVTTS